MKNTQGKTRPINDPYEVWVSFDGSWTWLVRKKYQAPDKEANNHFARWFCTVITPFTKGDTGDVYVREIRRQASKDPTRGRA